MCIAVALACASCYAQSVTIVNSGSTNTAGYHIVVDQSGKAEYQSQPSAGKAATPKSASKSIPQPLASALYADVEAARPLSGLPSRTCAKSASFGAKLTVRVGAEESPDLSCGDGGNEKLRALIRDTNAVVKQFAGK